MLGDSTTIPAPTPTRDQSTLEVVFALHDSDGRYWLNTAVAVASVLRHASRPIRVSVIHNETLSDEAVRRLTQLFSGTQHALRLVSIKLPDSLRRSSFGKFSVASIYRLSIPQVFDDQSVVLYLDSDLVACGFDVLSILNYELPESPISGVVDSFIGAHESDLARLEQLDLEPSKYINSGVLLIRPKLIKQDLLGALEAFEERFGRSAHRDQDFINYHFRNEIIFLEDRFNFQLSSHRRTMFLPLDQYAGKILHYAGKVKPLDMRLAPGILPFWQYTTDIPEIFKCHAHSSFTYLYPIDGDDRRVTAKAVVPGMKTNR
jgi:lipopolysaccharide biosynthesis glycosyltransferase